MTKKIFSKRNIFFLLILIISIDITYAQSIGATPKNTVEVKTSTPTIADFGVSQGSDYPEKITIEGNYDWITIEESEFILESKTGKTVKLSINIKKPGTHHASLRICASPITPDGASLSTKACTHHNLTVIATLNSKTKTIIVIAAIILIMLFTLSLIFLFRVSRKNKTKKNKHKLQ